MTNNCTAALTTTQNLSTEHRMIRIFGPQSKRLALIWLAALLVANLVIALHPHLTWGQMVMASFSLWGGLLSWQSLILRAQHESRTFEKDEKPPLRYRLTTWLFSLAIPLFFTGLFPWGMAHWFNLTLPIVVSCGLISGFAVWILHRKQGPPFRLRRLPLIVSTVLVILFIPVWSIFSSIQFPHHFSDSPAITLSGRSPDGQYRLRALPGSPISFGGGGYLKWSLVVEERNEAGTWQHFYPPPHQGSPSHPRHLGGFFIEGQWESNLRARWTGPRSFEVSYLHHPPSAGNEAIPYKDHCTIDEARQVDCDLSPGTVPLN